MKNIREGGCFAFRRNDKKIGVIPDAAKRRSGTQRLRTSTIDRTKVTGFRLSPE